MAKTKKKKPKRSLLVKKLDAAFSQYIRLKNVDEYGFTNCFTCGKRDHWKSLQNGHFQSRRHYSTRWDEINCQVQCASCNVFKAGEQFLFGKYLDERIGDGTSEELYYKSKEIVKFSDDDLTELTTYYKSVVDTMI